MSVHFPPHGGQLRALCHQLQVDPSTVLDFSANINPEGPPRGVVSALQQSLAQASVLTDYPDLNETQLKASLASFLGATSDHIITANGFVPILDAVLKSMPIQRCLVPLPAFNEYRKTLDRAGVEIIPHLLSCENSFQYDFDAMLTGSHDAILLANPQNPSGVLHSLQGMCDFVSAAALRNILVLLDEAFIDYCPEHSATLCVDDLPNLVVFRSVTKFYGFPGLRVAYAVAHPAKAILINTALPPWPITSLASVAVIAALDDKDYAERSRLSNQKAQSLFERELHRVGIHTYPASANFLLWRLPEGTDDQAFWTRLLVEHHVALRSCHDFESLLQGHLRSAVRTASQNQILIAAVQSILQR